MAYRDEISQHYKMHTTVFLSLLVLQNPIKEDVPSEIRSYGSFYHYKIDATRRNQVMQWNQKYKLNEPINGSFNVWRYFKIDT